MKKMRNYLLFMVVMGIGLWTACSKEEKSEPIPIAPIIKEVSFPNVNNALPGKEAIIRGKGFAQGDLVYMENADGMTTVAVTEVTNDYLKILLPKEAGGEYAVTIERAGLQTTLDGQLKVPFVIALDDVVMPEQSFQRGATVNIAGKGFETGDQVELTADFYPQQQVMTLNVVLTAEGISFVLPDDAYGINTVAVIRPDRKTVLGTIRIEAAVGDAIGGGIVFWVDDSKVHGYIANKENTGSPTEKFGPSVALSGAAGTSKAMGTGKSNTEKLLAKMLSFRQNNTSWQGKKSAAEQCDELVVTDGNKRYDDWFLPSQEELIAVFKVKSLLAEKGAAMPANNYWSSSEGDGDAAGWSAYYVNFYEAENIVSGNSDKEGWQIGIRAIRSF